MLQDLGRQADSLQADVDERVRAVNDRLLAAEEREQAAAEGEQRLAASAAEAASRAAAERQAATHALVAITLCIVGAYTVMMFDATYLEGSAPAAASCSCWPGCSATECIVGCHNFAQ